MKRAATVRAAAAVLGALVLVGLSASPAAADPPRPTNYRSTVTEVSPAPPAGVEIRVIGGDSLLELTVPAGHTAAVADYPTSGDEASPVPYLRFDADGTVRRNARAVATTANGSRYGTADSVPDPDAAPKWETVATDGAYAWHDHRIHWMSPTAPRVVHLDGRVDLGGPNGTWTVPITVDGRPTTVTGTLVLVPSPSPAVPLAAFIVGLVVALAVGRRFGLRAGSAVGALTGLACVPVALATWHAVPARAGDSPIPVVVASLAAAAGILGTLPIAKVRLPAVAATAAALLGWGMVRFSVLGHAVLPTTVAPTLDRAVTALAIGVGLALALLLIGLPRPATRPAAPIAPPIAAPPTA